MEIELSEVMEISEEEKKKVREDQNEYFWKSLDELKQEAEFPLPQWTPAYNFPPLINALGPDITCAEIGVCHGTSTFCLLEKCPNIKKYYAIDPYEKYLDWGFYPVEHNIMKEIKEHLLENFLNYDKRYKVEFIFKPSNEAKDMILDNSLDFLFIDGNHDPDFVYEDMVNYYPKVKSGGIFSGHDWDNSGGYNPKTKKDTTLNNVVYKFMEENSIPKDTLQVLRNINITSCWYWIKP